MGQVMKQALRLPQQFGIGRREKPDEPARQRLSDTG